MKKFIENNNKQKPEILSDIVGKWMNFEEIEEYINDAYASRD